MVTQVVLYGIDGGQLSSIFEAIERQASYLGTSINLKMVTDIDLLLESKLSGIPAIEVNGQVKFCGGFPMDNELRQLLRETVD